VSFVGTVKRAMLHATCAIAHIGIAKGCLIAFLSIFGPSGLAYGEIISALQPISGVSGITVDPMSYSIADINAAGGIVIGDKLFDSFSVTASSSANASAPSAAGIQITGVDVSGDYGFKANASWMASGGEWVNTTITYRVSVLSAAAAQGWTIDGSSLYITSVGGAKTTGGIASISENVYASYPGLGGATLADEFTYYMSSTNKSLIDSAVFAPVTSAWVVEDVGVSGGTKGGVMTISEFYQTFHQTVDPTQGAPEPSTAVLFGIGMLGFAGFAWRKRR
jgi:hypothetical protein